MTEEKKESPWRQIHERELPSGMKIRVRTCSQQSLVLAGVNPMPLLKKMAEAVGDPERARDEDVIQATRDYMKIVFDHFVVEPKVSMEYPAPDGFYSIAEITDEDRTAITMLFRGIKEDAILASFRGRQERAVPGPAVSEVREDAVGVPPAGA